MCDCIEQVNEKLSNLGDKLDIPIIISFDTKPDSTSRVTINTIKINGKGKPRRLFASYCPFCGGRYDS